MTDRTRGEDSTSVHGHGRVHIIIMGGIARDASAVAIVSWRVRLEVVADIAVWGIALARVIKALPELIHQDEILPVRHGQPGGPHQREMGLSTFQTK